jgi:hypothetical protein
MNIFRNISLNDQSYFQKLFKKFPKENALIELNNLLAVNEAKLQKVNLNEIRNIEKKYKINFKKYGNEKRLEFFKKYLSACLKNRKISQDQSKTLDHLMTILMIDPKEAEEIKVKESEIIFNKQVRETFNSGPMDDYKWDSLESLKLDLLLTDNQAIEVYRKHAMFKIEKFMKDAVADQRYSPEEEKQLLELAKSYGVNLKFDPDTKRLLRRYRKYWEIENGHLPEIISDINLQKTESLYFKAAVLWQEQRKITKRYNYSGPTARIKIAKGFYYRAGSISVHPQSEDVWQTIDTGDLYLTNKRLIFMGDKGNKTIPINKILDFTPYSNGIDIQKDSGKSPFLKFSVDTELFAMILSRLMNN